MKIQGAEGYGSVSMHPSTQSIEASRSRGEFVFSAHDDTPTEITAMPRLKTLKYLIMTHLKNG
jgi:hypothetical protein